MLHPVDEATPIFGAEEHDWKIGNLLRLDERERSVELIERTEASRESDERLRVLDEHRFANEEVAKLQCLVDPLIDVLLEGQFDVAPDGDCASLLGSFVRRFHDAGTSAGDDVETGTSEELGRLRGQ